MHRCTALTTTDGNDNKTILSWKHSPLENYQYFVLRRPCLNCEPEKHLLGLKTAIILTAGVNRV